MAFVYQILLKLLCALGPAKQTAVHEKPILPKLVSIDRLYVWNHDTVKLFVQNILCGVFTRWLTLPIQDQTLEGLTQRQNIQNLPQYIQL